MSIEDVDKASAQRAMDSTKIIEDADEIRTDRCAIVFGNALLPDYGAVHSFAGQQLRSRLILRLVVDSKNAALIFWRNPNRFGLRHSMHQASPGDCKNFKTATPADCTNETNRTLTRSVF
jgi:hypothetical protein